MKRIIANIVAALFVAIMFAYLGWKLHEMYHPPADICESEDCKDIQHQNALYLEILEKIKKEIRR